MSCSHQQKPLFVEAIKPHLAELQAGTAVAQYTVRRRLGQGAFGTVYRVRYTVDRRVAPPDHQTTVIRVDTVIQAYTVLHR